MKTIQEIKEDLIQKAIDGAKSMGMDLTREQAEAMVKKAHKDVFGTDLKPSLAVVKDDENE